MGDPGAALAEVLTPVLGTAATRGHQATPAPGSAGPADRKSSSQLSRAQFPSASQHSSSLRIHSSLFAQKHTVWLWIAFYYKPTLAWIYRAVSRDAALMSSDTQSSSK